MAGKKAKRYAENDYNLDLMRKIDELHLQHPSWGSRRNSAKLRNDGKDANRKRIIRQIPSCNER